MRVTLTMPDRLFFLDGTERGSAKWPKRGQQVITVVDRHGQGRPRATIHPIAKVPMIDPTPALKCHQPGMRPRCVMVDSIDPIEIGASKPHAYTPDIPVHVTALLHRYKVVDVFLKADVSRDASQFRVV
jgi:hypothetical protein